MLQVYRQKGNPAKRHQLPFWQSLWFSCQKGNHSLSQSIILKTLKCLNTQIYHKMRQTVLWNSGNNNLIIFVQNWTQLHEKCQVAKIQKRWPRGSTGWSWFTFGHVLFSVIEYHTALQLVAQLDEAGLLLDMCCFQSLNIIQHALQQQHCNAWQNFGHICWKHSVKGQYMKSLQIPKPMLWMGSSAPSPACLPQRRPS